MSYSIDYIRISFPNISINLIKTKKLYETCVKIYTSLFLVQWTRLMTLVIVEQHLWSATCVILFMALLPYLMSASDFNHVIKAWGCKPIVVFSPTADYLRSAAITFKQAFTTALICEFISTLSNDLLIVDPI